MRGHTRRHWYTHVVFYSAMQQLTHIPSEFENAFSKFSNVQPAPEEYRFYARKYDMPGQA